MHPAATFMETQYEEYLEKRRGAANRIEAGDRLKDSHWTALSDRKGFVLGHAVGDGASADKIIQAAASNPSIMPHPKLGNFYKQMGEHLQDTPPLNPVDAAAQIESLGLKDHIGIRGRLQLSSFQRSASAMVKHRETAANMSTIESLALKLEEKGRFSEVEGLAPIAVGLLKHAEMEHKTRAAEREKGNEAERDPMRNAVIKSVEGNISLGDSMRQNAQTHPQAATHKAAYMTLADHMDKDAPTMTGRDFIIAMDKNNLARGLPRNGKITVAALRAEIADGKASPLATATSANTIFQAAAETGKAEAFTPLIAGLTKGVAADYANAQAKDKTVTNRRGDDSR